MKKKPIETFTFLNNKFNIDKNIVLSNIFYLIVISILSYIGIIFLNIFIMGSIDFFDIRNYMITSLSIINGSIPYITIPYEYAILSLCPMILSVITSMVLGDIRLSFIIFQLFMVMCNIITLIAVYLIVLKLYKNNDIAFKAGLLYIISIVAIYTTLTRHDSLPVCLMVLSILYFVYKKESSSYIISIMGFFTKIFPIIVSPFFIIYYLKHNNIQESKKYLTSYPFIIFGILPIGLIGLYLLGGVDAIKPYLFASGSTINSVYANTFTYALYMLINNIIPISVSIVSTFMSIILGISGLYLLYYIYKSIDFSYKDMVLAICITLSLLIITSKFHSPQYFMWISPLLVVLVVDDIKKIIIYCIFQIMTFIEFPLLFGKYYTNVSYVDNAGNIPLLFFIIEYTILILLLLMCMNFNIKKKLLSIIKS